MPPTADGAATAITTIVNMGVGVVKRREATISSQAKKLRPGPRKATCERPRVSELEYRYLLRLALGCARDMQRAAVGIDEFIALADRTLDIGPGELPQAQAANEVIATLRRVTAARR